VVSKDTALHFKCPNCDALYQVIKVEAGPETVNHELTCRACGGPLAGREGNFVLKYFLLRKAGRRQVWKRRSTLHVAPR
jgi:predicted RNA-binding Zn-ribbon protein involved in translation (DUF1610 family)